MMDVMEPRNSTDLDRKLDSPRSNRSSGSSRSFRRSLLSFGFKRDSRSSLEKMMTARRFASSSSEYEPPSPPSPSSPLSPSSNPRDTVPWPEMDDDLMSVGSYAPRDSGPVTLPFRPERRETLPSQFQTQRTRTCSTSSRYSTYSIYPAPSKPLPPLPISPGGPLGRLPSRGSSERSSISTHRSSRASGMTMSSDGHSFSYSPPPPPFKPQFHRPMDRSHSRVPPFQTPSRTANVSFYKLLQPEDKKAASIFHLDMSSSLSTLASKHGNHIINIWSTADGTVQHVIKFSAYTSAQSRSREYLIRSHAILSEPSNLIAIATRFGRSIEVWNWAKKKCLQTIDNADRWTSAQIESYDSPLCSFAVYHSENSIINLYTATREKKPFSMTRTIDMSEADLPFVPQFPEIALSTTSPLVVVAAGPRPPRQGHPPPERETLLVAWETPQCEQGSSSNKPYRVARPWQHEELDTAIPCDLVTYGSAVVSIWIPASFRAVPAVNGSGYNLAHVVVPFKYVLVWDLAANSTRTFGIPNSPACVSPDCRFVAYCHASGTEIGARGCLVILDVITGKDVWSWPDPEALAIDSGPKQGFEQFDDLSKITELHFSADGKFLNVGDSDGNIGMYEVNEQSGDRIQLHAI